MRALPIALVAVTLAGSGVARADDLPSPEVHRHTAAPWIVTGVGATVAAIGVLSFVGAVKAHDDVASESSAKGCTTIPTVVCPVGVDGSTIKTNLDGEHAMNVLGVILTAAGGLGLIGGLVWHFTERPRAPSTVFIAPSLGPNYGGVGVVASF